MKARLATALFEERERRGGGDARRFPQPEMARLLDYSLRQYQRLEDADDPSLPAWGDLERIMDALGLDADAIFAENGDAIVPAQSSEGGGVQATMQRVLAELQDLRAGQDEIARRLGQLEDVQSPPTRRRARGA